VVSVIFVPAKDFRWQSSLVVFQENATHVDIVKHSVQHVLKFIGDCDERSLPDRSISYMIVILPQAKGSIKHDQNFNIYVSE
jgi:hypothetical protein